MLLFLIYREKKKENQPNKYDLFNWLLIERTF